MLVREPGEPPPLRAAFGWALLIMLLTWLVVGEVHRVTTPPRPVVIVVPTEDGARIYRWPPRGQDQQDGGEQDARGQEDGEPLRAAARP